MKIIKKDLKQGIIDVRIESLDDLWVLHTVVQKDDLISGETERKIKLGQENERNMRVVRKKMFLEVKVLDSEFSKHTQVLRIQGLITKGPEDVSIGGHHTINVETGSVIKIQKQWKNYEIEKLKKSELNSGKVVLITLFDREDAIFAKLDVTGTEKLLEIKGDVEKKAEGTLAKGDFYKEISTKLDELFDRFKPQHIIIASPGFWREYLQKELSDKVRKKSVFSACSDVNMSSVNEVIKRPELAKSLKDEAAANEEILVSEFLKAIHDGKASIGMNECYEAINSSKAEKFLVSENLIMQLRQDNNFSKLEKLMIEAENTGCQVHLIGSKDATKQLDGIGGVGCINRWS